MVRCASQFKCVTVSAKAKNVHDSILEDFLNIEIVS